MTTGVFQLEGVYATVLGDTDSEGQDARMTTWTLAVGPSVRRRVYSPVFPSAMNRVVKDGMRVDGSTSMIVTTTSSKKLVLPSTVVTMRHARLPPLLTPGVTGAVTDTVTGVFHVVGVRVKVLGSSRMPVFREASEHSVTRTVAVTGHRNVNCTLDATAAPSITTSSLGSTTPHRAWVVVRAGCPHTATSDRNVEAQERGAEASGTVMVRLRVVTPRPQDPLQALQALHADTGQGVQLAGLEVASQATLWVTALQPAGDDASGVLVRVEVVAAQSSQVVHALQSP